MKKINVVLKVSDVFKLEADPQAWVNRYEDFEVLVSSRSWRWNRQRLIKVIELACKLPWVPWETMVSIFGTHARAIARECEILVGDPITAPEPTPRREKRGGRMTVDGLLAREAALALARARAAARRRGRQPRRPRPEA